MRRNNVSRVQLPVISKFGKRRGYKRLKLQWLVEAKTKIKPWVEVSIQGLVLKWEVDDWKRLFPISNYIQSILNWRDKTYG
ncbi:hypothetical protein [Nostoc sp. ChiVER01]|uniref:hypothetical protein n=1 Tax=Nostoc sp. ChiVER01 TaxID=3075382 RepID=UPI002AD444B0|nr:hypothetical protein [Nostoc sp. ChiVER01]MDZ8225223.1 hypothetical protein [Nostoc sp. ChiVER01]